MHSQQLNLDIELHLMCLWQGLLAKITALDQVLSTYTELWSMNLGVWEQVLICVLLTAVEEVQRGIRQADPYKSFR